MGGLLQRGRSSKTPINNLNHPHRRASICQGQDNFILQIIWIIWTADDLDQLNELDCCKEENYFLEIMRKEKTLFGRIVLVNFILQMIWIICMASLLQRGRPGTTHNYPDHPHRKASICQGCLGQFCFANYLDYLNGTACCKEDNHLLPNMEREKPLDGKIVLVNFILQIIWIVWYNNHFL